MRRLWLIFAQTVTVFLALWFVLYTLKPHWVDQIPMLLQRPVVPVVQTAPSATMSASTATETSPMGFREAAKRASPTVVSVLTRQAQVENKRAEDPWFRFFFGEQEQAPEAGVGSGVIVSADGYVLTNNHVIDRMSGIEIMLTDGRRTTAQVIGKDPDTDLAVLKVDMDKLPSVVFGDSDALQIGDAVLAIGNPFGVGQTVTSGIVSALGRNQLGINTFENFIQTDAAINPGNSGGALVDAQGYLVGINSAIYSRSGGNMGIGFAIPASTARLVMESLIRDGKVTRGWIGVEPRDLTPEIAETFNLPIQAGVLITGVLHEGPAAVGGLQPGDVVVKIGQTPIGNTAQLLNVVAGLKPDTDAAIQVQRADKVLTLSIRVAQRPQLARQDSDNASED
jgi:serine protease DegQ